MTDAAPERSRILLPLLAAVLLSGQAAYVGWTLGSSTRVEVGDTDAEEGAMAPILTSFRLPTIDGRELGPQDFSGDVLVVDFWATWCAPCRVQARILDTLREEYEGKEVHFIAVSLGEDEATVKKFTDKNPFPYPVLYDEQDRISIEASIFALPTVMVINRGGTVEYLEPGLSGASTLREAIDSAAL